MLIVGVVYFVTKELYRIRGGNIGKVGISIIGILIGVLLLAVFFAVSAVVIGGHVIVETPIFNQGIYNTVYLTPTIIIIVMFVTMVDRRLVFPLFIFQIIAMIILYNKIEITSTETYWASIMFNLISYVMLAVFLYFAPTIKFIKKNGVKIAVGVTTTLLTLAFMHLVFFLTVSSTMPSWFDSAMQASIISINIGYLLVYSIIQAIVILLIEKIYSNFNALETFSTKDDVSYYKMSLAQNSLIKMIDEEKINIGALVLFQIKADNETNESKILEKIRIHTEDKFKNTFYFKASASYYGAFFELSDGYELNISLQNNKKAERTEDDELWPITNELQAIEKAENAQIIATSSIYGIQSYSISELIEHARFLMSPIIQRANTNPLIVYDYKRVKERLNETAQVRNLPVDAENINVSFLRGLSSEEIYYPLIMFKNDEKSLADVISENNINHEEREILFRHSAYQTIRKFNKKTGHLVLYYSITYLDSESFNPTDFAKKVERYIDIDRIIIGLNTSMSDMGKIFKKNVEELRELGIRFAIINPKTVKQKEHDTLNPEFILDPITDANPLKITEYKLEINTNATLLNPNLVN